MAKNKETISSALIISKEQSYKELKILLAGIDKEREAKFNSGEKIEVTKEELNEIGEHRWLIKEK